MTVKHSYDSGSPIDQHHILPSNYPSRHALDESDGHSRSRQPLTDSAGNTQLYVLDGLSTYNDSKLRTHRYPVPTLPYQPKRQSHHAHRPSKTAAQLRREDIRQQKHYRHIRNPIIDQPQYKAYRQRQAQEGKQDDKKWPDVLEDAFLDALMDVPNLGRRKFSYKGKPHGRNELIQEYIWLAYCQSLPPGQKPDPGMIRQRKQVSSHIQVLKHFMKDTPAFGRLFPKKLGPKNGFEDNFKSDPTLRALSEGRLPAHRLYQYESISQSNPMKPALFWIKMTSCHAPSEDGFKYKDTDMYSAGLLAHKYTSLSNQGLRTNLENIENWRLRFPYLADLHAMDELECDIIHMDVALELTATHAPEGSDLIGRITMSIPGRELSDCAWQSITTLTRPPELLRDPNVDPHLEAVAVPTEVLAVSDTETQLKVPFPANAWAHTFTSLTNIQLALEERENMALHKLHSDLHVPSVRHCVEQITMYQELESRSGPSVPFIKRAILLWTFRNARSGEAGTTTWRYLDPPPPRDAITSTPVPLAHHDLAGMNENFNTWRDAPIHLQSNMLDPFVNDLGTPSTHTHSAGLQSPFQHISSTYGYHTPSFALPDGNMSFVSESKTLDSESTTLVDAESQHQGIDRYLADANVVHVTLDYEDGHAGHWHLHADAAVNGGFEEDTAWAGYSIAPAPTPVMGWEGEGHAVDGGNGDESWDELHATTDDDGHLHHHDNDVHVDSQESWIDGSTQQTQHEWGQHIDEQRPLIKHSQSFIEQHLHSTIYAPTPVKHSHSFDEQHLLDSTHPHTPTKHSESFTEQHLNDIAAHTPVKHPNSFIDHHDFHHDTNPHTPVTHSHSFITHHLNTDLPAPSPIKHSHSLIEQALQEKLVPWVREAIAQGPQGFVEVSEDEILAMENTGEEGEEAEREEVETQEFETLNAEDSVGEGVDNDIEEVDVSMTKEQEWVVVEDGFEYEELVS